MVIFKALIINWSQLCCINRIKQVSFYYATLFVLSCAIGHLQIRKNIRPIKQWPLVSTDLQFTFLQLVSLKINHLSEKCLRFYPPFAGFIWHWVKTVLWDSFYSNPTYLPTLRLGSLGQCQCLFNIPLIVSPISVNQGYNSEILSKRCRGVFMSQSSTLLLRELCRLSVTNLWFCPKLS